MPFIDQTNDRKWHKAEVALQLPELPLVPLNGHPCAVRQMLAQSPKRRLI